MLCMLKKALAEERNIKIIYMADNGEITERIINILSIKEQHVESYCYYRKAKRVFKIENILSGQILMYTRTRRKGA